MRLPNQQFQRPPPRLVLLPCDAIPADPRIRSRTLATGSTRAAVPSTCGHLVASAGGHLIASAGGHLVPTAGGPLASSACRHLVPTSLRTPRVGLGTQFVSLPTSELPVSCRGMRPRVPKTTVYQGVSASTGPIDRMARDLLYHRGVRQTDCPSARADNPSRCTLCSVSARAYLFVRHTPIPTSIAIGSFNLRRRQASPLRREPEARSLEPASKNTRRAIPAR